MLSCERRVAALITLLAALLLAGCTIPSTDAGTPPSALTPQASNASGLNNGVEIVGDGFPLTVTDVTGHSVTFDEKPQRVAVISGTPLNIFYDAGGTAIAGPNVTDNIRLVDEHADAIKSLPAVGPSYSVNIEALAALNPDLVITMAGSQDTQLDRMHQLGMRTLTVKVRSLDDVKTTYRIFGALNDTRELAERRIAEISEQSASVMSKWPGSGESTVILYVTAQTLNVKLDNSIAGEMVNALGLTNIASGLTPDNPGSETTPLDIEEIVRQQPDYVLVTSMISSNEQARKTLGDEMARNPGWQAVDAVRAGRVIYLPQQYFLFNAGPHYADALKYLAASIHPEIYGQPQDPA